MKTRFIVLVCFVLLTTSLVQAAIYTEASADGGAVVDSGFKPYSSVDHLSGYCRMSATAEAGINWAKGISRLENADGWYSAESISRFTTTFEVVVDGYVSLDLFLDGELRVFIPDTDIGYRYKVRYELNVSDSISNDNIEHFGKIIDKKCLLWAINKEIICDYVIQTIITDEEKLENDLLRFNINEDNDKRLFLTVFASLKSIQNNYIKEKKLWQD